MADWGEFFGKLLTTIVNMVIILLLVWWCFDVSPRHTYSESVVDQPQPDKLKLEVWQGTQWSGGEDACNPRPPAESEGE